MTGLDHVKDYLANRPHASRSEINAHVDRIAKGLLREGKFDEAQAALNHAMDHLGASRAEQFRTLHQAAPQPSAHRTGSPSITERLPVGLSLGKATAIVAGVGLIAAGLYALRKRDRSHPEQHGTWVSRVEAQRNATRTATPTL